MSLGTLALIGICGLCGPLLSAGARGAIPAVVGEILAGWSSATPDSMRLTPPTRR